MSGTGALKGEVILTRKTGDFALAVQEAMDGVVFRLRLGSKKGASSNEDGVDLLLDKVK